MKQRLNIFPNLLLVVLCDYGEYTIYHKISYISLVILKRDTQMEGIISASSLLPLNCCIIQQLYIGIYFGYHPLMSNKKQQIERDSVGDLRKLELLFFPINSTPLEENWGKQTSLLSSLFSLPSIYEGWIFFEKDQPSMVVLDGKEADNVMDPKSHFLTATTSATIELKQAEDIVSYLGI